MLRKLNTSVCAHLFRLQTKLSLHTFYFFLTAQPWAFQQVHDDNLPSTRRLYRCTRSSHNLPVLAWHSRLPHAAYSPPIFHYLPLFLGTVTLPKNPICPPAPHMFGGQRPCRPARRPQRGSPSFSPQWAGYIWGCGVHWITVAQYMQRWIAVC